LKKGLRGRGFRKYVRFRWFEYHRPEISSTARYPVEFYPDDDDF